MKKISQIYNIVLVLICIIVLGFGMFIHHVFQTKPTIVYKKGDMTFDYCHTEVFTKIPEQDYLSKIHKKIDRNKYALREVNCANMFPEKRDIITEKSIFMSNFLVEDNITKNKKIDIPENVVMEKSKIDVNFSFLEPSYIYDSTFFGFSLGKLQNRGDAIQLSEDGETIFTSSYSLDEVYYGDDLELRVSNVKGNDLLVEYKIDYYIQY